MSDSDQTQRQPLPSAESIATAFEKGKTRAGLARALKMQCGATEDEANAALDAAEALIAERRQKAAETPPVVLRDEDVEATAKRLSDNDKTVVTPERMTRMADKLRQCVPTGLDHLNKRLTAARSGPITYEDVAFVALLHRDSVTRHQPRNVSWCGTSPYKRIVNASAKFHARTLDHRQITYALDLLTDVQFTQKTNERREGTARQWAIVQSPFWDAVFACPN